MSRSSPAAKKIVNAFVKSYWLNHVFEYLISNLHSCLPENSFLKKSFLMHFSCIEQCYNFQLQNCVPQLMLQLFKKASLFFFYSHLLHNHLNKAIKLRFFFFLKIRTLTYKWWREDIHTENKKVNQLLEASGSQGIFIQNTILKIYCLEQGNSGFMPFIEKLKSLALNTIFEEHYKQSQNSVPSREKSSCHKVRKL